MSSQISTPSCRVLYDEKAINALTQQMFTLDYWAHSDGYRSLDAGRGGSCRFKLDKQAFVLRRYLRGGLISKFNRQNYLWTGLNATRPWREWQVLKKAMELGLPVAPVVAACVERRGLGYRGALITRYQENSETLAERLIHSSMSAGFWNELGRQIKRLQSFNIRHDDLNANNILLSPHNKICFIDFDKAEIMTELSDWQWMTLRRLQRSLEKIRKKQPIYFNDENWLQLMDGYQV